MDVAITFEGEDMGCDPVEEPAVVGDYDNASRKIEDGFFEGSQGIDVQVVGRFVEEQDVASASQQLGEVDSIAFPTGEDSHFFLLVGPFEIEFRHVGAGVHPFATHVEPIESTGDFLVDCALRV